MPHLHVLNILRMLFKQRVGSSTEMLIGALQGRRYNILPGIKSDEEFSEILNLFIICKGKGQASGF